MQIDHEKLPIAQRYIRFAGIIDLGGGVTLRMVICMTSDMSYCLLTAKRVTIDTSFQRLHGLDEFEIEFWDNLSQRCKWSTQISCVVLTLTSLLSNSCREGFYVLTVCRSTLRNIFKYIQSCRSGYGP